MKTEERHGSDARFVRIAQIDKTQSTLTGDVRPGRLEMLRTTLGAKLDRLAAMRYTNQVAGVVTTVCLALSALLVGAMVIKPEPWSPPPIRSTTTPSKAVYRSTPAGEIPVRPARPTTAPSKSSTTTRPPHAPTTRAPRRETPAPALSTGPTPTSAPSGQQPTPTQPEPTPTRTHTTDPSPSNPGQPVDGSGSPSLRTPSRR